MSFVRAYVAQIKMHFDPVAMIVDNREIVVAYGLATIDLLRLKNCLPDLNKCGLLLVGRKNTLFRFVVFKEVVVGIFPGFKELTDEIGLSCAYDFQLKDISKLGDYQQLSRWITLKETERLDAENRARVISSTFEKSRLRIVLGLKAIEIIENLMWATNVFEPLHAITILAKTKPLPLEITTLRENLRGTGLDLWYSSESTKILLRKKTNITLMDCAKSLFSGSDYYFEAESSELSGTLGIPIDRLSSHFRGYLIVDDDYVNKLFDVRVQGG